MNRYPAWKYVLIVVVLLIAALYTLPNFFGEAPAVQISSSKSTVKVDTTTLAKVEQALKVAGLTADGITLVTRGRDLFEATHIHRLLQALLGLPVPDGMTGKTLIEG